MQLETDINKNKNGAEQKKREMTLFAEQKVDVERKIHELSLEAEKYMDEINRIRYIEDPSQLTLEDIHKKLREIDPNLYREAMHDLEFEGSQPVWARYDFLERIRMLGKDG